MIPLPAEAPAFLTRLVHDAAAMPSLETLKPLHSVLDWFCCTTLDVSCHRLLIQAQHRLIGYMASLDKNAHAESAFCLALLARLASTDSIRASQTAGPNIGSEERNEMVETLDPAKRFFGNKNIAKLRTMTLVR